MTGPLRPPRSVLPRLFAIQFLSWGAMFCLWVYVLPVIGRDLGNAGGTAPERMTLIAVSGCFALYALVAAALAFAVPAAVRRFGAGTVHGVGLLVGAAGFAVLGRMAGPWPLAPAFLAIAVGWSCMANIPYALASAAAPPGRGARTLRLFGFSTVVPQIVVSLTLAAAASYVVGDAVAAVMLLGAGMMASAGLLALAWRAALDLPLADW